MSAEYSPYQHVETLRKGMADVKARMAAAMPPPNHAPAFTEHADGSVTHRGGQQMRPPREQKGTE